MNKYNSQFFLDQVDGSRKSAEVIVPIIIELIQPSSVIDVGCGLGHWLDVFRNHGVSKILGVDGDYVDRNLLAIPIKCFMPFDLKEPLKIDDNFDLVVSLEVAEHIPEEFSDNYVNSLTSLSPIILFSAAIPGQGGTNHVNEQWPTYWVEKLFSKNYMVIDCIREQIWNNKNVEWWYSQNILIFGEKNYVESIPSLKREMCRTIKSQLSLVHPNNYFNALGWEQKLSLVQKTVQKIIPSDKNLILIDEGQLGKEVSAGRKVARFIERDGEYYGPPADSMVAINELNRLGEKGFDIIVFAWPSLWWLNHYKEFRKFLNSNYKCIFDDCHMVAFEKLA